MIREYTIEYAERENGVWVCQRGTYDPDSVLAGQEFRQLVRYFTTVRAAQAAYPQARFDPDGTKPETYIPREAPEWFDELDAGEVWHEDDY